MRIDLNCDLGEGAGSDADLMPLITSCNIACGFHAGDAYLAAKALQSAREKKVVVGAHPGYNDKPNFGRLEMTLPPEQLQAEIVYQVGALKALAEANGVLLHHIKPHGALYHQANWDPAVARTFLAAVEPFGLALVGLPGTPLADLCHGKCRYIAEGFADRRYLSDGGLVHRSRPDAFVKDPEEAVRQVEWLIREKGIETLCVHGDNPQALEFVKIVRQSLVERGISISSWLEPKSDHE